MIQYKKVAFYTLGCKLNFSETSTISRNFEQGGYSKVKFEDGADIYVINTCSVTDNADNKLKSIVKKAKKYNPNSFVAVIGCYAQLKPQEIIENSGVDLVLGANEKFNIIEHLEKIDIVNKDQFGIVINGDIKDVVDFKPSYSFGDRTRTFLKVQDGCDYSCSFCTIPLARGKSRSNSIEKTIAIAKEVAESSAKEIVLTGVNLGDFGVGTEENFYGLVKELDKINGIDRIRISSIEPNLLNDEIIEFTAKSNKFVPHFHIPLQSGSPELLKLMRRRYKREIYTSRVEKIKTLMPEACIGVDVIVGFPGETDELFMETYKYLNELPISYLHVFTYSERDNTLAVEMGNVVSKEKRAERSKILHILSDKKRRFFYESQLGKTFPVLWEAEEDMGMINGFTSNYIKVKTNYQSSIINTIQNVQLQEIDKDGIFKVEIFQTIH